MSARCSFCAPCGAVSRQPTPDGDKDFQSWTRNMLNSCNSRFKIVVQEHQELCYVNTSMIVPRAGYKKFTRLQFSMLHACWPCSSCIDRVHGDGCCIVRLLRLLQLFRPFHSLLLAASSSQSRIVGSMEAEECNEGSRAAQEPVERPAGSSTDSCHSDG